MSDLPDNRLRFPAALIDFEGSVGLTGQSHDDYPAPEQQPRFDWMRMAIIALLSNQSSFVEPTQFRQGTPWFDLNTNTLKIRVGERWSQAAEVLGLDVDQDGNTITLAGVYPTLKLLIAGTTAQSVIAKRSVHTHSSPHTVTGETDILRVARGGPSSFRASSISNRVRLAFIANDIIGGGALGGSISLIYGSTVFTGSVRTRSDGTVSAFVQGDLAVGNTEPTSCQVLVSPDGSGLVFNNNGGGWTFSVEEYTATDFLNL